MTYIFRNVYFDTCVLSYPYPRSLLLKFCSSIPALIRRLIEFLSLGICIEDQTYSTWLNSECSSVKNMVFKNGGPNSYHITF